MTKSIKIMAVVTFFVSALFSVCFSEESISITTYYPSPYGSYNELTTTGNTYLATTSGNVGIGTASPDYKLEVEGTMGITASSPMLTLNGTGYTGTLSSSNTTGAITLANATSGPNSHIRLSTNGSTEQVRITSAGNVGIGTVSPAGKLDVNGTIYQRGGLLHADYVFEPGYKLESIEEHAKHMWQEKHLKAIPKGQFDENGLEMLEIGADRRGLLEELEKAHIYIEQLNGRIKTLEENIKQLQK